MKTKRVTFGKGFRVLLTNHRVQAAQMVIAPGKSEGGLTNRHRNCDQWLFVQSGSGLALLGRRRVILKPLTLLLIERGERHEIRTTGATALKTLNFYSPPGYTRSGDALPAAKP